MKFSNKKLRFKLQQIEHQNHNHNWYFTTEPNKKTNVGDVIIVHYMSHEPAKVINPAYMPTLHECQIILHDQALGQQLHKLLTNYNEIKYAGY